MKLRHWQSECIQSALLKYTNGEPHYLCLATPGAGKTIMASVLAKNLLDKQLIDLVVCITPSIMISEDFRVELEFHLGSCLNGKIGSLGRVLTYQSMLNESDIWELFDRFKVFVIFDEIHHCAGLDIEDSNAWGQTIISKIKGRAIFTLALTGTPWRSNGSAIALGQYSENGEVKCDYVYGLTSAIRDNVCRTPKITLYDNDEIKLSNNGLVSCFKSFEQLFSDSPCNYQSLIENEQLMIHILTEANKKLDFIRVNESYAGGLIVASSVKHAKLIHKILLENLSETAEMVTYLDPDAISIIKRFKASNSKWIISVGMISEGTNIPRLKVCCYLTRVKTELYFRQVLGRVLRVCNSEDKLGYFYMPAEPLLLEFASRVNEDVPSQNIVDLKVVCKKKGRLNLLKNRYNYVYEDEKSLPVLSLKGEQDLIDVNVSRITASKLSKDYEQSLDVFGYFHEKVLSLKGASPD